MIIIYDGKEYHSFKDLASKYDLSINTVKYRLLNNLPLEYKRINIGWWNNYNNKFYPTLDNLSNNFNLNSNIVSRRHNSGYSIKTSLLSKEDFEYLQNDKEIYLPSGNFKGLKSVAKYYGLSIFETDQFYRNNELTIEETISDQEDIQQPIFNQKRNFKSLLSYWINKVFSKI